MTLEPLSKSQKASLQAAASLYYAQGREPAQAYLAGRGISAAVAAEHRIGLVSSPMDGHDYLRDRLAIPYLGPRGNVYNLRFRCLRHDDCKAEGCNAKYMSLPGYPSRVFNVRAIVGSHATIHVTEGELDCISLCAAGLAAIGIPGVENLPRHFPRLVAGFSRVVLWADSDEAGRDLIKRFQRAVPRAEAVLLPDGQDVNSLLVTEGVAGLRSRAQRDGSD